MRKVKEGGFTLIELMITVAIVAILAAIAYPSYIQYLVRGNRTAAQAQMMDLANREQQYLLSSRAYADKTTLESATSYSLPSEVSGYYTYTITTTATPPAFTITFTPISGTAQASDSVLTLDSNGTKTPSSLW
jgi:type IV pilus assembly protein PilE